MQGSISLLSASWIGLGFTGALTLGKTPWQAPGVFSGHSGVLAFCFSQPTVRSLPESCALHQLVLYQKLQQQCCCSTDPLLLAAVQDKSDLLQGLPLAAKTGQVSPLFHRLLLCGVPEVHFSPLSNQVLNRMCPQAKLSGALEAPPLAARTAPASVSTHTCSDNASCGYKSW